MPPDPTTSTSKASTSRHVPHKRTYQACKPCRSAKLRCDLGSPDAPHDPPCRRCLRTGRECVFSGVYQKKAPDPRSAQSESETASQAGMGEPNDPFRFPPDGFSPGLSFPKPTHDPFAISPTNVPSTTESNTSRLHEKSDDFRFVRGETLENPADALRILCAAAEDDRPQADASARPAQIGSAETDIPIETGFWNRWIPVRDGLLTADEARELLIYFGNHLNPCHPLVPAQVFQPAYFSLLLREPILLAAMIGTAARYLDLGSSFDLSEPSRSRVIQEKLVTWLLQRIGYIAMGETSSRTIGTVEALLILSEWPPRANLLRDISMSQSTSRASTSQQNPCKVYDDLSWTLIGLAVRIAQELELHDENTYGGDGQAEWTVHRRHNAWIYCLSADRHASVRLGRASLIQEMSTCWWETLARLARITGDDTFPFPRTQIKWRESLGAAELTHMIGLLQELLYATPDVTSELIKTGRFETTLHRLKPELDSLWQMQAGDLPTYSIFETKGETFTDDELREIRWRCEYDYVRLYANAIAMRAAQARLLRRHKSMNMGDRVFQANVLGSTEGPFVLEAVDAAISLVRCGVSMQRKQVLRHCPCRTFLRLVFASVFLMKAVSFGAVAQPEHEIVDLQYSLIDALNAASPDEQHIASHLASLLGRVFPSLPSGPTRQGPIPDSSSQLAEDNQQPNPLSIFGFDTATALFDWDSNLMTGFGYDPSSLVSDIEEMLAAADSHQSIPIL